MGPFHVYITQSLTNTKSVQTIEWWTLLDWSEITRSEYIEFYTQSTRFGEWLITSFYPLMNFSDSDPFVVLLLSLSLSFYLSILVLLMRLSFYVFFPPLLLLRSIQWTRILPSFGVCVFFRFISFIFVFSKLFLNLSNKFAFAPTFRFSMLS